MYSTQVTISIPSPPSRCICSGPRGPTAGRGRGGDNPDPAHRRLPQYRARQTANSPLTLELLYTTHTLYTLVEFPYTYLYPGRWCCVYVSRIYELCFNPLHSRFQGRKLTACAQHSCTVERRKITLNPVGPKLSLSYNYPSTFSTSEERTTSN